MAHASVHGAKAHARTQARTLSRTRALSQSWSAARELRVHCHPSRPELMSSLERAVSTQSIVRSAPPMLLAGKAEGTDIKPEQNHFKFLKIAKLNLSFAADAESEIQDTTIYWHWINLYKRFLFH